MTDTKKIAKRVHDKLKIGTSAVTCPKCGCNAYSIDAYSTEENKQTVELSKDGTLDWSVSEVLDGSCRKIEFACPNCHETLYKNRGDSMDKRVIAFFKGIPFPTTRKRSNVSRGPP